MNISDHCKCQKIKLHQWFFMFSSLSHPVCFIKFNMFIFFFQSINRIQFSLTYPKIPEQIYVDDGRNCVILGTQKRVSDNNGRVVNEYIHRT